MFANRRLQSVLRGPGALLLGMLLGSASAGFVLRDGAGKSWALAEHLGRERLLFVVSPSAAYLAEIQRQDTALQLRDLRVVALLPPGDPRLKTRSALMLSLLADPGGNIASQYGPASLVGKDGGVKAYYKSPPALPAVLGTVDAMPMRQQERRVRGQ
jgi:Domain of unknown function (DUF4174)